VSPATSAAAITAGIAVGPWLRGLVFAHAVGFGQPHRTRCPHCGHTAVTVAANGLLAYGPWDGRCRTCASLIGPPPGPVELAAAVLLAMAATYAPSPWVAAAWSWTALFGVALAWIDTTVHRLPDILTNAATAGALSLLAVAAFTTGSHRDFVSAAVGAAGLGVIGYALTLVASLGRGDAQLSIAIGLCVGWTGPAAIITAVASSVLLAATSVVIQLATRRIRHTDPVALGPFLLAGAVLGIATTIN